MRTQPDVLSTTHPTTVPGRTRVERFFLASAIVALSVALRWLCYFEHWFDATFLLPMVTIAIASVVGGLLPGVLATAVLAGAEWGFNHHGVAPATAESMPWLIEGGLLMSIVSGQVHNARRQARASDAATLDLERKVLEISDEERRRIGHDLHDGLGQHLTGISFLSTSLAHRIARNLPDASQDAEQISQLVTQSIVWTRDLARGLSPVTLESEGLYAALEELADNARSLFRIQCQLECDGDEPAIDKQQSMHIFRIVQEAVSNSVKHGKARMVQVHLTVTDKMLTAKIADDGCGLSAKTKANPGLGLRIMNYRARMVGATLWIERITMGPDRVTPASGTIITLRCPLQPTPP